MMTNCIPQQFVDLGQIPKKLIGLLSKMSRLVACLIVLSMILPVASMDSALAQSTTPVPVPPACLDDFGNPVQPVNEEGAWAIILNFNHPKSTEWTRACWAVVDSLNPRTVSYHAGFRCRIINNVNNVEVGAGQAPFDGNFRIRCPRRRPNITPETQGYDTFIVHAKAKFPQQAGTYRIFKHQEIEVNASFLPLASDDNQWQASLVSNYNGTIFSDTETLEMVPDFRFGLQSTVLDGEATHHINRHIVENRREIGSFTFDYQEPFVIGKQGQVWTLYAMVIDPPPPDTTID